MESLSYFAYGSNMLANRLQERCPSAHRRCAASVSGYSIAFCKKSKDGSGKATLVSSENPEARVHGVVFDISRDELAALDRTEGRGKGYDRVENPIVATGPDGQPMKVTTYIAQPASFDPALKPYDWYLDLVAKGAEQHGLPEVYVAALAATAYLEDRDDARQSRIDALALLATLKPTGVTMKSRANIRIAGKKTVGEWVGLRAKLTAGADAKLWKIAHHSFFMERLRTRYYEPIEALQGLDKNDGEGFAIVAIQRSLIEFLGATLRGQTYIHRSERKGRDLTALEYGSSGEMIADFLCQEVPFKTMFDKPLAKDFYVGSDAACCTRRARRMAGPLEPDAGQGQ